MDKIKLSNHIKQGDTFYTPFTDPNGIGKVLSISSWAKSWLPEFLWIAIIIHEQGRKTGCKTIYKIIEQLNESKIAVPQMSKIFALEKDKQELFWRVVLKYIPKDTLAHLTVVITPDVNEIFYNQFFDFTMNVDDNISKILDVVKVCNGFHDELTTDICFIVDWFYLLNETLHISNELNIISNALTEYYKHSHEDEIMRTYRPIIRSTFQGLCSMDCNKEFADHFWKVLGEISECRPLKLSWDSNKSLDFYKMSAELIEYFSASNEELKMDTKYSVIMGMTCYIYQLYQEIVEKNLQNDIGGRILFRTILETYINLKYLLLREGEVPDIYERYKAYGIGKYKLVMAKLREEKYSVPDCSQLDKKYMELMVNEDMDETFVNMSVGFFDKISVRSKFQKCGEDELYEIYYEYTTNYAHGIGGAIRESSMLICNNPAHAYHMIPDYYGNQNLRSILDDCQMIMKKTFDAISSYVGMPDFYAC